MATQELRIISEAARRAARARWGPPRRTPPIRLDDLPPDVAGLVLLLIRAAEEVVALERRREAGAEVSAATASEPEGQLRGRPTKPRR